MCPSAQHSLAPVLLTQLWRQAVHELWQRRAVIGKQLQRSVRLALLPDTHRQEASEGGGNCQTCTVLMRIHTTGGTAAVMTGTASSCYLMFTKPHSRLRALPRGLLVQPQHVPRHLGTAHTLP